MNCVATLAKLRYARIVRRGGAFDRKVPARLRGIACQTPPNIGSDLGH